MKRVYFVRPIGMEGPVKIGCTSEPVKRLKQLMLMSPFPLEIVAMFPGDESDEAAMQGMFAGQRLHGEWFAASDRLTALIASIQQGDPIDRLSSEYQEAKSAMRVASGVKSHLTRRVNDAEKRMKAAGVAIIRPDHIRQAIAEYTGPHLPAPTAEHRALIDLYVRELDAMLPTVERTRRRA